MVHKPSGLAYRRLAAAVAVICAPGVTAAQTQVDEEILVTGSFISRPADRPQPVSVMDAEEIRANQRVTLAEVVRDMPQITSANTTNNWQTPTNSINLRGLGERSTLILLNGQRMTIDANSASQVDINNLAPQIMVERMELLLDGASALYGSDAVAGVANFITRDRFEGIEFNLSSQWADTQTDVPEIVASGIFGLQGNDSGLVMAFEMQRRDDKLQEEDRFSNERLEYGLKTGLWNPGTFFGTTVPGPRGDPRCNDPSIGATPDNEFADPAGTVRGPFCRGLLSLQRTSVPEQTNMTGMAVYTKDFDAGGLETMRIEASYARAEAQSSFGTGVPLLALPSVQSGVPALPATNPGVIEANVFDPSFPVQDYGTVFSRQLSPLDGDSASKDNYTKQNTYRVGIGLEGVFGDSSWTWRANGIFSQNDQEQQGNDTITDRYLRALAGFGGPACKFNFVTGAENDTSIAPGSGNLGTGNCYYWNPFASRLLADPNDSTPIDPSDPNSLPWSTLYNSPELLDWMSYGGTDLNQARFTSFEWVTTGDLWEMGGGATGLAVGAQIRKQELAVTVDPISKDGGFGFSPQILQDWQSNRETDAVFVELVMFPSDTFEIDLAARWEDTEGQSSTEPKVSMLWTPTDNLFVRATAGSSFRLGSENQLFGVSGGTPPRDTIGGETTQAVLLALGNDQLVPEESDNWTLGLTWDVTDNFTFDVTYWDYEFTNLITQTDEGQRLRDDMLDGYVNNAPGSTALDPLINLNSPHPLFAGRPNEVCDSPSVIPGGTGRWNGTDPLPDDCLSGFDFEIFRASFVNRDIVITNGIDLTFDWQTQLSGGGDFGIRYIGSYTLEYSGRAPSGQIVDVVGTDGFAVPGVETNPDLRANVIVTYGNGPHSVRGTFRYTSGTELTNPDPNPDIQAFDESSYTQLDLVYSLDLNFANPATLSFSMLNVTDEEPPLVGNALLTYDPDLYDGRGRMFRLVWNQAF